MSILVLGGAGYIGSHTALELIRTGESVIIADNLATGHIEAVPKDAKFYLGDLHDKAFLDNIFENEQIDAVIHFAAYSLVGESVVNPLKYYDNNLCGTKILLDSMVEHHIDKIVFSSTAATYGEPENIPILETDRTQPTNPYGETKLAMEKMFYWTSKAHGLKYVSLRYFNACGADKSGKIGEVHNLESHLIPLILQVPNGKRESISIYGTDYDTPDGTCIRDYIHVSDLAQAHILAVKYLKNGNESNIFNLGNGVGYSVKEVIDKARKVTGHPIPAIETPKRAGDPARLVASSEKARKILGWNPVHDSLEEIISDAWNWHNQVCADDDPYTVRLKKLTEGLTEVEGMPLNFKVYYVIDVNAFACADGSVRVFSSLMDIMTDEELLGVIGHEVGHVAHKDSKNGFRTALLTSALKDGISSQGGKAAALTDSQLGDLGEALVNATYSQKQERAADDYGYEFLKKAGKNPWAMALSFQKLKKLQEEAGAQKSSKLNQLFSTHPDLDARIQRMEERATSEGIEKPANTMGETGK